MSMTIYEMKSDEDMDFFLRLGFWALKTLRTSFFEQIMKNHPNATDDEAFEIHKKETTEYMDFSKPEVKVFIASHDEKRCGYLWMAPRNSKDCWDIETPQWIYDIVVDPEFQGRGIGRKLMDRAENYARELGQNIGLFVHEDNESAIGLYKKTGYQIKVIPISKKLMEVHLEEPSNTLRIKAVNRPKGDVRNLEFCKFKEKVLFSTYVDDDVIMDSFDEFVERSIKPQGKQSRFVVYSSEEECVGSAWIGTSGFDEKIAMLYSVVVPSKAQEIGRLLIDSAEAWAFEQRFATIYILLHIEDDLDLKFFQDKGYKVPGYFMELRI